MSSIQLTFALFVLQTPFGKAQFTAFQGGVNLSTSKFDKDYNSFKDRYGYTVNYHLGLLGTFELGDKIMIETGVP